jgi:hypothetical protein
MPVLVSTTCPVCKRYRSWADFERKEPFEGVEVCDAPECNRIVYMEAIASRLIEALARGS